MYELTFSARVQEAVQVEVRAGDEGWSAGDAIGLFAKTAGQPLSEAAVAGGIENLKLRYANGYFSSETRAYTLQYPEEKTAVDFIAYYPYGEEALHYIVPMDINPQTGESEIHSEKPLHYVVPVDVSLQHDLKKIDLLYADNARGLNRQTTTTPELLFTHQLSRIVLDIEMADGRALSQTKVTIAGMKTKAFFSLVDATLRIDPSSEEIIGMNLRVEGSNAKAEAIVLPVARVEDIALQIVTNGQLYDLNLSEKTTITSLAKGRVYHYKVRLTREDATMEVNGYNEWPVTTHGMFSEGTLQVTHRMPVAWLNTPLPQATGEVRNYTILYSKQHRVAYWVAYPMYEAFLGSTSRTDDWEYDPLLPSIYQPYLASSWVQTPIAYSRGHQLPSADRTSSVTANRTTFYYSNMAPQNQSMNGDQWAKLEDQVRKWCRTTDTLYVVTGILLPKSPGSLTYAEDRRGNKAAVPLAFYKALAKKVGNQYHTIGYKMENRPLSGTFNDYRVTVTSLEQESGLVFFPKITDSSVKDHVDQAVWN